MSATLSLTQSDVFAALGDFLTDVLPAGVEVLQGQVNRVPSSASPNYVVMWPLLRRRLSTNHVAYDGQGDAAAYTQPTELSFQVDVHGPASADNAQMVSTLMRSPYACEFMPDTIQPLHADDPRQVAFETGEKQVEDRWAVGVVLQANPVTTTVQQFADAVTVGLIEVDATYPPGAP